MSARSTAWLQWLPLLVGLGYLLSTYALFWIGPFDWPIKANWVPIFYLPCCFALLAVGFIIGKRQTPRVADTKQAPAFLVVGACAAVLLLVPTAVTYTGKLPWEVGEALRDQKAAYSALADQVYATQGSRGPIAALRTLSGPLIFCVLPLGIMLWPRLSTPRRIAVVATILTSIDLSILRGTTRELADIFVIGTSAYLVRIATAARAGNSALFDTLLRHWKSIALGIVVLSGVLTVLIGRTEIRANGKFATCLGYSQICADLTSGIYSYMDDSTAFGAATVTAYFAQGYYGLSIAAEKPFQSTFGLGHSPALSALAVNWGVSEDWIDRSYTFRNGQDAWSDVNQWSTMWAWIANDVGFPGALFVTLIMGFIWGLSWRDAVAGDIRASIVFCIMMLTIFYAPANLQISITFEAYATVIFWTSLWLIGRSKREAAPLN